MNNVFLYNRNNESLLKFVRHSINFDSPFQYNEELKLFFTEKEYILTNKTKINVFLQQLQTSLTEYCQNSISNKNKMVIVYNVQFIHTKHMYFIKYLLEKTNHRVDFVFTSNVYNQFYSSFLLCKHVKDLNNDSLNYIEKKIEIDCINFFKTKSDISQIKVFVNKLVYDYVSTSLICKIMCKVAVEMFPENSIEIVSKSVMLDRYIQIGNKFNIYLEYFILEIIFIKNNGNI